MIGRNLSSEEKATIAVKLLLLSPPNQFKEVYHDLRFIVEDDPYVLEKIAAAAEQYNKDQMINVQLPDSKYPTLITFHNDLGNGYFMCPRNKVSFHYDHLEGRISNVNPLDKIKIDDHEQYRLSVEKLATDYVSEHFPFGAVSVFKTNVNDEDFIVICIQSLMFKHQSAGRWRSEWKIKMTDKLPEGEFQVHGTIKVQVHFYEKGNVQLISSKRLDFVTPGSSNDEFMKEIIKKIEQFESTYQVSVCDNFKDISDTTFKTLRRQLPVTKSKIDWDKILTYQIGSELSRPQS